MLIKQGYVFIGSFGNPLNEFLFGKPISPKQKNYENIQSNRLTLFEEVEQADKARKIFAQERSESKEDFKTTLAYLWLKIAEREAEAEAQFAKSKDLVVIASDHSKTGVGDILMGRKIEGKPTQYPLYGARMSQNGFAPILNLDAAKYIASEAHRQGEFEVTLARFKLRRLKI